MDEFFRIIPQFKLDEITTTNIDNLNEKINKANSYQDISYL